VPIQNNRLAAAPNGKIDTKAIHARRHLRQRRASTSKKIANPVRATNTAAKLSAGFKNRRSVLPYAAIVSSYK
jgi:hypothetical protein